ncbi:MAG: uroporphyrinogen decarboxylase family protein [Oscillospiraceae bacterium]|nr:uroporphyrinogen decarboxylase family protein [Oscillospiraceae bacterium]
MTRQPDFGNILKILRREAPSRHTLFEFFLNDPLYKRLAGMKMPEEAYSLDRNNFYVRAFANAGYDYATIQGSAFHFPTENRRGMKTVSLNEGFVMTDRESFDAYEWPDPDAFDYSGIGRVDLPDGMKLMVCGPCGVLENVTALLGYENLCVMLYEDPQLVHDVFAEVGLRLLRYYENCVKYDTVGLLMVNDDWGFKTQTMLSPAQMREYVFPWHRKIVELAHNAGKPAVLHSCGFFGDIMDDVIDVLKFDGKHSYEDNILPVEDAYRQWGDRIAILGGIDLNFVVSETPEKIRHRCKAMLAIGKTGYALGTGNSVPEYVPVENYFAMTGTVLG